MKEDLGIKVIGKDKVFWQNLKEKLEKDTEDFTNSIEINNFLMKLVEKKLK